MCWEWLMGTSSKVTTVGEGLTRSRVDQEALSGSPAMSYRMPCLPPRRRLYGGDATFRRDWTVGPVVDRRPIPREPREPLTLRPDCLLLSPNGIHVAQECG